MCEPIAAKADRPTTPEALEVQERIRLLADTFTHVKIPSKQLRNTKALRVQRRLTDREVLAIRQDMWNHRRLNLKLYAQSFGVVVNTIHRLAIGVTYEYLNAIVPPITKKFDNPGYLDRRRARKADAVRAIAALRNHNPDWWTYERLAKYLSRRVGDPFGANYTRQMVLEEDPDLWDIDTGPIDTSTPSMRKRHSVSCTMCKSDFESLSSTAKYCSPKCAGRAERKRQSISRKNYRMERQQTAFMSI